MDTQGNLYFMRRYIEPVVKDDHTKFAMICADCHHEFLLRLEDMMKVKLGIRECFSCEKPYEIMEKSIVNTERSEI